MTDLDSEYKKKGFDRVLEIDTIIAEMKKSGFSKFVIWAAKEVDGNEDEIQLAHNHTLEEEDNMLMLAIVDTFRKMTDGYNNISGLEEE